ncbi:cornifelin homolog isoform X1 [Ambystoma mexicanum]|uniref:cornifelin homolog isoform X1 n=2 Tax=Ambystoma mexicanum TaxID=8296 RepID=UPI0037E81F0A
MEPDMSHPISSQPQSSGYSSQSSTWNTEVMDCMDDMGICLCGTFIPCYLMCKVSKDFGECFCLPLLPGTFLALRTAMRERWRIEGSICNDFLCMCLCGNCVLCQMARELKRRH